MFNLKATFKKLELQIRKIVGAIKINENDAIDEIVDSIPEIKISTDNKIVKRKKRNNKKKISHKETTSDLIKIHENEEVKTTNSKAIELTELVNLPLISNEALFLNSNDQFFNNQNTETNKYKISSSIQPLPKGLIALVNIYSKTS